MPSITVTIDLPDDAYRYALTLPLAERERMTGLAAAIYFATAANEKGMGYTDMPSAEDIAAIAEAIEEEDAGIHHDGDAFFSELFRENGWKQAK